MKRRDFFKAVTGFVAGVFAAFVPKAKSEVIGESNLNEVFTPSHYMPCIDKDGKLTDNWLSRKITFPNTGRDCYSDGHIYVVEWRTGKISPRKANKCQR